MKVLFCAGVAPVVRVRSESVAFYRDLLGLPLGGDEYVATDAIDGIRHFGLWPLEDAARSCTGSTTWPADLPVPQAAVELDVDDLDAAAAEAARHGHRVLRGPFEEPWGQRVVRLLGPEGLIVGLTHTPWYRDAERRRVSLQGATVAVTELDRSRRFYEDVLGFEPGDFYEPTRWQPYRFGDQYFAIRESADVPARHDHDVVNFTCADVTGLWERVRPLATVVEPLATTPWGSHRFVVADPDGFRLGFVQEGQPVL